MSVRIDSSAVAIREQLDATLEERQITLCNSGIIAISAGLLWNLLPKIKNSNAKGEYYLTDLVELGAIAGSACGLAICPESEVAGVNDRVQLAGQGRRSPTGWVIGRCAQRATVPRRE